MGQRALIVVLEKGRSGGGAQSAPATLYEVDLDDPNGGEVQQALRRHVRKHTDDKSAATSGDAAAVRRWARRRDLPVSTRGRISAEIWRQYHAEVEKSRQNEEGRQDTVADAINRAAEEFGENVVCIGERWQQRGSGGRRE